MQRSQQHSETVVGFAAHSVVVMVSEVTTGLANTFAVEAASAQAVVTCGALQLLSEDWAANPPWGCS
jgi:hypothetical protein